MLFDELMNKLNESISNKITANELVEWFKATCLLRGIYLLQASTL